MLPRETTSSPALRPSVIDAISPSSSPTLTGVRRNRVGPIYTKTTVCGPDVTRAVTGTATT